MARWFMEVNSLCECFSVQTFVGIKYRLKYFQRWKLSFVGINFCDFVKLSLFWGHCGHFEALSDIVGAYIKIQFRRYKLSWVSKSLGHSESFYLQNLPPKTLLEVGIEITDLNKNSLPSMYIMLLDIILKPNINFININI